MKRTNYLNYFGFGSDEGYSRKARMLTKLDIYVFSTITVVDTSAGGAVVPESITRPENGASAPTCFFKYFFFYRNLQFLNYIIIIKLKVLLPHVYVI
jgi:hypothetical protein